METTAKAKMKGRIDILGEKDNHMSLLLTSWGPLLMFDPMCLNAGFMTTTDYHKAADVCCLDCLGEGEGTVESMCRRL